MDMTIERLELPEQAAPVTANNTRARRWVDEHIKRGKTGQYAELVRLSPEIAAELLARNPDNRTASADVARQIAEMITDGRWQVNGETIKVSRDGALNDGQTRCAAVAKAGEAIDTWMIFGLDRESRFTVDFTRKRSADHLIKMEGNHQPCVAAAVARLLQKWVGGHTLTRGGAGSTIDVFDFYQSCSDKIDAAINFVASLKGRPIYGSHTGMAFCYAVLADIDEDEAGEFIAKMQTGEGISADSIIWKARQRIQTDREKCVRSRNQYHVASFIGTVFAAWNQVRSGNNAARFHVPENIPAPK